MSGHDAGTTIKYPNTVSHRHYIGHGSRHYVDGMVDSGHILSLFGDLCTDLTLQTDGVEGLLAGYRDVSFHAPTWAGDLLEMTATVIASGNRSRTLSLEAKVQRRQEGVGTVDPLMAPQLLVATATATVVVSLPRAPWVASATITRNSTG